MAINCNNCGTENSDTSLICSGCNRPLQALTGILPEGTILEKRYKIDKLIKTGGMGSVYKARDGKLDRICAVKELLPPYGTQDEQNRATEWFKRESTLLARLDHASLPGVIDYFVSNGRYYLVMNFIEGEDLETLLAAEGNPGMTQEKVITLAVQILEVLGYLHSQNPPVVYRDLKPANIMLHKDGRVILIDFGIARSVNEASQSTKTSIGTVGYAPIEQYQGRAEPRSDIYALGATMHHLLTGIKPLVPFMFERLKKIIPHMPDELDNAVMKALSADVSGRFNSAGEMKEALEHIKCKPVSQAAEMRADEKEEKIVIEPDFIEPFVLFIPGGSFFMGSDTFDTEKPVHKVNLSSFCMSKYHVTNKEYSLFLNSAGNLIEGGRTWIWIECSRIFSDEKTGKYKVKKACDNLPAVGITWYGAVAYCNWLSDRKGYEKCYGEKDNRGNVDIKKNGFRLPTEAEWEYACRAGTNTEYFWGDAMDGDYCWHTDNSGGLLHEVGKKKANNFGLYDMIGNTGDWCSDWFVKYLPDEVTDPSGPVNGTEKIVRGASYIGGAFHCRSANRPHQPPEQCFTNLSFRPVRSLFDW